MVDSVPLATSLGTAMAIRICAAVCAVSLLLAPAAVQAGDVAGSRDPAFLKRFEGSEIVYSRTRSFDDYALVVPDPAKPGATKSEPHEGAVTRLFYRVPAGHTALELLRNYEQAVRDSGLAIAYELTPCAIQSSRTFPDRLYNAMQDPAVTADPFVTRTGSFVFASSVGAYCALTARGKADGQDVGLTVAIVEEADPDRQNRQLTMPTPILFAPGETLVMVDIVSAKSLQTHMVVVKAADMADALATKGVVDLYGIYFDTDKADIKPESAATLDEVASLLRIDRALKLEVSGHTDNTGAGDHNMKLSLDRAQAVVAALVGRYHIDPKRLVARGYGDTKPVAPNDNDADKAKNRRVELKKA